MALGRKWRSQIRFGDVCVCVCVCVCWMWDTGVSVQLFALLGLFYT